MTLVDQRVSSDPGVTHNIPSGDLLGSKRAQPSFGPYTRKVIRTAIDNLPAGATTAKVLLAVEEEREKIMKGLDDKIARLSKEMEDLKSLKESIDHQLDHEVPNLKQLRDCRSLKLSNEERAMHLKMYSHMPQLQLIESQEQYLQRCERDKKLHASLLLSLWR